MQALSGIRVLDLSRLLIGGYLTQALADLGAEVIKVEEPRSGEPGRHQSPRVGAVSYYHLAMDRNKQSIRLNLKDPRGKEALRRLVRAADVLVENFRPGVMERLHLGYEQLAAINPKLVYCALSGFGQTGPRRNQAAHDLNLQAMGGHLALSAPGGDDPPVPGALLVDMGSALWGATAILAALLERNHSGLGQYIDLSMFDVSLSLLGIFAGRVFADPDTRRPGELTGLAPNYNIYRTADGRHVALAAWEEAFWAGFCKAVGRPDLVRRAATPGEAERQVAQVRGIFAGRTLAEWLAVAEQGDFCLTPVNELPEAFQDPQSVAREMVFTMQHPQAGPVHQIACPVRLSRTPASYRTPPPAFGQDTRHVLLGAGYTPEQVATMEEELL